MQFLSKKESHSRAVDGIWAFKRTPNVRSYNFSSVAVLLLAPQTPQVFCQQFSAQVFFLLTNCFIKAVYSHEHFCKYIELYLSANVDKI